MAFPGSFSVDDVTVKIWNYDRLSEYYTTDLLVRFLPSRYAFKHVQLITSSDVMLK